MGMEWHRVMDVWLPRAPFAGRLAGKQAREFEERGGCRTDRFRGFCERLRHFDPDLAARAVEVEMAKSNLVLSVVQDAPDTAPPSIWRVLDAERLPCGFHKANKRTASDAFLVRFWTSYRRARLLPSNLLVEG